MPNTLMSLVTVGAMVATPISHAQHSGQDGYMGGMYHTHIREEANIDMCGEETPIDEYRIGHLTAINREFSELGLSIYINNGVNQWSSPDLEPLGPYYFVIKPVVFPGIFDEFRIKLEGRGYIINIEGLGVRVIVEKDEETGAVNVRIIEYTKCLFDLNEDTY